MKDAKGHGSNKRGNLSVADQHQHRILRDTVKNPLKGQFLGGPNAQDSESTLRSKFGYSDAEINRLKGVTDSSADVYPGRSSGYGPRQWAANNKDAAAAKALASGPKSAAVPVHDSMAVGDRVHLGFGAKGGAGYFGRLTKNDGSTAEIKHDNGKTYTGPSRHLSK